MFTPRLKRLLFTIRPLLRTAPGRERSHDDRGAGDRDFARREMNKTEAANQGELELRRRVGEVARRSSRAAVSEL